MEQLTGLENVGLRIVFCCCPEEDCPDEDPPPPPPHEAAVPGDAPGGDTPEDISDGLGELEAEDDPPPAVWE